MGVVLVRIEGRRVVCWNTGGRHGGGDERWRREEHSWINEASQGAAKPQTSLGPWAVGRTPFMPPPAENLNTAMISTIYGISQYAKKVHIVF